MQNLEIPTNIKGGSSWDTELVQLNFNIAGVQFNNIPLALLLVQNDQVDGAHLSRMSLRLNDLEYSVTGDRMKTKATNRSLLIEFLINF